MPNVIEIKGLKELMQAFKEMPKEVGPSVVRSIARKPANKVASIIRSLFPFKNTGKTKRSFGIRRVKSTLQMFLEVGIKGKSLAYIFIAGAKDRRKKSGASTGNIEPLGNIVEKAAEMAVGIPKEMEVELSKVIAKAFKRYSK
jgi:hypothetical protein